MTMTTPNIHENTLPVNEASRLLYLIDHAHGRPTPLAARDEPQNAIQLPRLSAIFPGISSGQNSTACAPPYPTPGLTPSDTTSTSTDQPHTYVSPYSSPEQHAISTYIQAIRRGFSFHRKCIRHLFIAYDEAQFDQLLADFQTSLNDGQPLTDAKACEVYSASVIASTFNRVEIPAGVSDVFYRAASERIGTWVLTQPLTAMQCCALLGLANLFQKATISLLYFDLALALSHGLWRALGCDTLDMGRPDHVEYQQIWRSLVFGRAWLQSTIGECTSDALLWLPPLTIKADNRNDIDTAARVRLLVPVEIARVSVIGARAMRVLSACSSSSALWPAVQDLFVQINAWHDDLPHHARMSQLSQTPWDDSKVGLAYVHLGHLGAITLVLRRTLSIYEPKSGGQKHQLQSAERENLAAIFKEGVTAARQISTILEFFLSEFQFIRHCWTLIYIAFISAAVLLYCISQMQLHDYPHSEWQPYLTLVDVDMEILAYCQELDPVAGTLRDTLSQYMQFLRVPSTAPKRKPTPSWAREPIYPHSKKPQRDLQGGEDLVDLLLTIPQGRAGPVQTSLDLFRVVCQPFNDLEKPRRPCDGYRIPHVLGNVVVPESPSPPRKLWGQQANKVLEMPFGWQQCQSSTAFTGKSTNLALTMAQQEMLRAGV